ncbi:TolC family protein [Pseudomonadota bacterium]
MIHNAASQGLLRLAMTAVCALVVLGACATYQPLPLADETPLAGSLEELSIDASEFDSEFAGRYEIKPDDGLDLTEIGIVAVLNNPELKAQRAAWQLAGAQAFAAGLLPDPQLAVGLDRPTGDRTGLVNPWLFDLSYDIVPLITRQARIDAAQKGQEKVYLDLLWREWQVIQQARSMAVRLHFEEQQLALLHSMRSLYLDRYQRSTRALQDGNVTLDINGTDLTALVDILSQIKQLEQQNNQTRHSLNFLLGLAPQVAVTLSSMSPPDELDASTIRSRLDALPGVRPDLLALQAGYASQEANVRAAILSQFPSIGIGVNNARDSGNIHSVGLSISLSLPLFNGNKGNIAIERATRAQLREEYNARLASTEVDVDQLLSLQAILLQQQNDLQVYLPKLETLVESARHAYAEGDIDALTFLNMESTWVNKRLEQINLSQVLWENRIAVEALLALPGYPPQALLPAPVERDKT